MSALSQVSMRRSLHPQTTKQSRNRYLIRGVPINRDASFLFFNSWRKPDSQDTIRLCIGYPAA